MLGNILIVAIGGAAGSVLRYLLTGLVQRQAGFPVGTFLVNLIGCFVVGWVAGATIDRSTLAPNPRLFLMVGFCGGFTTFSAFSYETVQLVQAGHVWSAGVNVAGQVVAGLAAVWAGLAVAKWL